MRLQTVVSREVDPADHAVVTVASLQAGDAENVVADDALLKLDIRTMRKEVRDKVLKSVRRIVEAESVASGAVKPPGFVTSREFPLLVNDDEATGMLERSFGEHFEIGKQGYTDQAPRLGGSEDFGILGRCHYLSLSLPFLLVLLPSYCLIMMRDANIPV